MEYDESAIFDFGPQQVYDVVADIERYPEFLPGWRAVTLLEREANRLTVEQEMGFAFANWRFKSVAILDPPSGLAITSREGPFEGLDIRWGFTPLAGGKTAVNLTIRADSAVGLQQRLLNAMVGNASRTLLEYFRGRVSEVYAPSDNHPY